MLAYKAVLTAAPSTPSNGSSPRLRSARPAASRTAPKPLNVREWTCGACGTILDRDITAAANVAKAARLAVTACGARVRPGLIPAQREETGTHPKPQPVTTSKQTGISAP
ncbi:hypothetical protein ACWGRF_07945 [Streptomyces zhihengii]